MVAERPVLIETIYVDDDNTDGPWDGTQEHPYQYIQDAIDVASDGDTVFVYNGTYFEHHLLIEKTINLVGKDKNTTIIDFRGREGRHIKVFAHGVKIKNFTIQNDSGISYGIFIERASNVEISNNIFKHIFMAVFDVLSSNNAIFDNIFQDNIFGIGTVASSSLIKNNIFVDNTFGVHLQYFEGVVEGNFITTLDEEPDDDTWGIVLRMSSESSIIGNNISVVTTGITVNGFSFRNTIENNVINNVWDGFQVSDLSVFNTFSNNHIANARVYGIRSYASFFNRFEKNNFINNNQDVYFDKAFMNRFKSNYWDTWDGSGPMIIDTGGYSQPTFNIDWRPAKIPYEIPI